MSGERGLLFDEIPEEYDRVRPSYPDELVDRACSIAGLSAGSQVVEVGCGTGKLTVALAARGLHVDAVDPGRNLVEVARRRVASSPVRFHVGRFEDVELPAGAFEAVFSATAFHWVDPDVSWTKAARLLRPGGVIALLTHVGGSLLELHEEVLAAWREVLPEAASWYSRTEEELWQGAEARRENVSEVWAWFEKSDKARPEAAQLFGDVEIAKVRLEHDETAAELIEHIRTTSSYLGLDAPRRERVEERIAAAVESAGGSARSTSFATLVTARARPAGSKIRS
jgi:ubiquinone/menaquinone biosynthesis C-methylase UbiE